MKRNIKAYFDSDVFTNKEEALDRIMWRNRFGRGFGPVVWQITDDDDVFTNMHVDWY